MATKKETATETPVANHETENVTITNSGDPSTAEAENVEATSVATAEAEASTVTEIVSDGAIASADLDPEAPANIPPATEIDPSGAPIQIVPDVDLTNPAVDANPRANTTAEQNRIDFNDPTLSGREAVEKALGYKPE